MQILTIVFLLILLILDNEIILDVNISNPTLQAKKKAELDKYL